MNDETLRMEFERYHSTGECRCTVTQRLVGDGCIICNPAYAIELLNDRCAELEAILEKEGIEW